MGDPSEVLIPNSYIMCKFRAATSAARALRVVSELTQLGDEAVTMVALDLDRAVLDRATGSTGLFQARRELLERLTRQR